MLSSGIHLLSVVKPLTAIQQTAGKAFFKSSRPRRKGICCPALDKLCEYRVIRLNCHVCKSDNLTGCSLDKGTVTTKWGFKINRRGIVWLRKATVCFHGENA